MVPTTNYRCEYCGFTGSREECEMHEAAHLGLTVERYRRWQELKRNVKQASYKVNVTKNERTEEAFDEAIKALVDFEELHGIETR